MNAQSVKFKIGFIPSIVQLEDVEMEDEYNKYIETVGSNIFIKGKITSSISAPALLQFFLDSEPEPKSHLYISNCDFIGKNKTLNLEYDVILKQYNASLFCTRIDYDNNCYTNIVFVSILKGAVYQCMHIL